MFWDLIKYSTHRMQIRYRRFVILSLVILMSLPLPNFSQMKTGESILWSFHQVSSDNQSRYGLEEKKNMAVPLYYDLVSRKPVKINNQPLKRAYLERGNQYFAESGKIFKKFVDQPLFDSKSNITSLHMVKNKLFFTTATQELYEIELSHKPSVAKKIKLPDIQYIKVGLSNPSLAVVYCEKPKVELYEIRKNKKNLLWDQSMLTFLVFQNNIYFVDDMGSLYAYDLKTKKVLPIYLQYIDVSKKALLPEPFILGATEKHLYFLEKTEHSLVGRKFDLKTLKEVQRDWKIEFFDNLHASESKWLSNENALLYIEDDGNAMYKYNFITGQQTYLVNPNKGYLNMKYHRNIESLETNGTYACFEDGYLFRDAKKELQLVDFTSNSSFPVKELLQKAYTDTDFSNADLEYIIAEPFSNSYLTFEDGKSKKRYGLRRDFESPYSKEVLEAIALYETKMKKPPYRIVQKDGFVYFYTLDKSMSMAKLNAIYSLKTAGLTWQ